MRPKPIRQSSYVKMFLVTPPVYNKLLNCIDEREKQKTEELNALPEEIEERPSERIIEQMNREAMDEFESEPISETIQQPISEPISETSRIFGDGQGEDVYEEVVEKPPAPIIRERQIIDNPLRTSCSKTPIEDEDEDVELLYDPNPKIQPAVKNDESSIAKTFSSRLREPKNVGGIIKSKNSNPLTKLNKPNLIQKGAQEYRTSDGKILRFDKVPKIILKKIDEPPGERTFEQPQSVSQIPQVIVEPNIEIAKSKIGDSLQCVVCLKDYKTKPSLKRHMTTVHRNLEVITKGNKTERIIKRAGRSNNPNPSKLLTTTSTNNFPDWSRAKPIKRSATEAKFKTPYPKRSKEFQSWT